MVPAAARPIRPSDGDDPARDDPAGDARVDLAFRALADGNRRAILTAVRAHPRAVGDLADTLGLSQQTTSHHLAVLRGAGLVRATRDGARNLYAVETDGLAAVRRYLDDFWPNKLADLKAAVERAVASRDATPQGAVQPEVRDARGSRDARGA